MIIDNGYFIDEIFIPHAKPSITDDVVAISANMTSFIETYSREALIKCLGYALFKEFSSELDPNAPNGLKATADIKWNELLNGKEYTDPDGNLVYWKGIRHKTGNVYNKSFLADYTYFFYEKSEDDDRTGTGNVKQQTKNAVVVSKAPKVIAAWRRFVKDVQGEQVIPTFVHKNFCGQEWIGGVDWYGQGSHEVSLYKFINDSNKLVPDTYAKFFPFYFTNINQFGI